MDHLMNNTNKDIELRYIIISRDSKVEKKCTLFPLRGRPDFSFWTKDDPLDIPSNSMILFPDGEPFSEDLLDDIIKDELENEGVLNIVLIDSRWKKAKGIADGLPDLRKVSLEGYVTGAQRKDPPPKGGLASVEALYLASIHLGIPDPTLLSKYHFKDRFLRLNGLK
jgi:hypothetical protein